jgi:outer membrane protein OmpA-like peptidoglycan-associated protein
MKRLFFVLITVVLGFTVYAQNSHLESVHVFFPANSANLRGVSPELALQNQKALTEIAEKMLKNPQYRILIDGHANPVLKTTSEETESLIPLSLQRATAVANYLVEMYSIDSRRLILAGAGGRYASRNDETQNRRVNLFIIMDS